MSATPTSLAGVLSSGVSMQVTHQVYVRHMRTADIALNGEREGFVHDPLLRCDVITPRLGARVATASITYVPELTDPQSFEDVLSTYSPDDQVMVVVQPIIDELQQQPIRNPELAQDVAGTVLFEGVLLRPIIQINRSPDTDNETVVWQAWALPAAIDNRDDLHLIDGRIVPAPDYDEDEPRGMLIESHVLPAVFNFRGRPNRHATAVIPCGSDMPQLADLTAPVFTHDHDPAGKYWTVRDALKFVLLRALFGSNVPVTPFDLYNFPRTLCLSQVTLDGIWLSDDATRGERSSPTFAGLDAQLPELNIHGMHVLTALETICATAGFYLHIKHRGIHILPVPEEDEDEDLATEPDLRDRPYIITLYRKGTGWPVTLDLAKRNTSYELPEEATADNSIARGILMRDTQGIENTVYGQGMALIEASWEIFPLWNPADMADDEVDAALQAQPTDEELEGDAYFARHTSKGSKFGMYGHIGRRWGLACLPDFMGYDDSGDTAAYEQDSGGHDFLGALGINEGYAPGENPSGITSGIAAERVAAGVNDPVQWMKRRRLALPLVSQEARLVGRNFILEVSEDGGETWQLCPVQFRTLTDDFGISINLDNLATVNQQQLAGGPTPAPEDSWWGLIQTGDLFFRLTCAIECDHGGRCDAFRQPSSGTVYPVGGLLPLAIEEVWRHTQLHYWPLEEQTKYRHVKLAGDVPILPEDAQGNASLSSAVRDATLAYRDMHEDAAITGNMVVPVSDFSRYQLGQVVTQIRGRNFSLATSSGDSQRYPTIVGMTYRLGGSDQSITLTLDDTRLSPG